MTIQPLLVHEAQGDEPHISVKLWEWSETAV